MWKSNGKALQEQPANERKNKAEGSTGEGSPREEAHSRRKEAAAATERGNPSRWMTCETQRMKKTVRCVEPSEHTQEPKSNQISDGTEKIEESREENVERITP
jgi:hypothetical protein